MADYQEIKASRATGKGWVSRLMEACRGPRALPSLGILSFLESSFLPVPIDMAMVPICLARPRQTWLIILVGALSSVAGAALGYLIGAFFMGAVGHWLLGLYGMEESFSHFRDLYERNGWLAVVVAGITPIPFKAAAIVSGAAGMRMDLFILAAFAVRFVRFAMIAFTIRLFGPGLQKILEGHGRKFVAFMVLVMILGFMVMPVLT